MGSLDTALNISVTALRASQFGLSVASNNIANAQNPDYARQRAIIEPGPVAGDHFRMGTGVRVAGIEAIRDQMIESRRTAVNSDRAAADLLNRNLSGIEPNFTDTDDAGLLSLLSRFLNSFQNLSTDPASSAFRYQVQASGQALSDQFKAMSTNLLTAQ